MSERDAALQQLDGIAAAVDAHNQQQEADEQENARLRTALEEVHDAFRTAGLESSYTYADGLARAALTPPERQG